MWTPTKIAVLLTFFAVGFWSGGAYGQEKKDSVATKGTTTGGYVVYVNGKRDHRAELRLMQQHMHNRNGRQGFGEYTKNRINREFDHRLKRKIDAEVDRVMDKIF